eukprot:723213-Amphidinium_carterae.1
MEGQPKHHDNDHDSCKNANRSCSNTRARSIWVFEERHAAFWGVEGTSDVEFNFAKDHVGEMSGLILLQGMKSWQISRQHHHVHPAEH